MKFRLALCFASLLLFCAVALAEDNPFNAPVLDVRPRVFIRNDDQFAGLSVSKLRERVRAPEFAAAGAREKWRSRPLGRAILWMLDGKKEDLDAAIAGLKKMDAGGSSWSDRGPELMQLAALFDWVYGELDEPTRQKVISTIEKNADDAVQHVRNGQAPFFYSRTPGALAGLVVAGIALHGVSPKADTYLDTFRKFGVNEYFRAYDWVDGAATGATYTMNYTYLDLPSICAAWWSGTGQNPTDWIRQSQGDWLNDLVRFYVWYMRPGFAFTHINDQFRGDWDSHDEFCQGLDIASYVTRNGYGRAWSQRWLGRFGPSLYHSVYAHTLMFRDPTLAPKPLTDLPHAELFGRDSCGYGYFRSSWPAEDEPDNATHVFFRCGDPMDVHGGVAAGEFQIFRYAPLADRSGRYGNYDSDPDQYHRNCISANVVLFTDPKQPKDRGDQNTRRGLKSDHATWQQWLDIRERNGLDVAKITDWKVNAGEAHCRADLTKANPESKCKQWIREFIWLRDKHLIVLDIVETASPDIRAQWQLHLPEVPEIKPRMLVVTNNPPRKSWADARLQPKNPIGRLFCQTLLPEQYTMTLHSGGKAQEFNSAGITKGSVPGNPFHLQYGKKVVQLRTENRRTVFLNVLTAVDSVETTPPKCSVLKTGQGQLELSVEGQVVKMELPAWAEQSF